MSNRDHPRRTSMNTSAKTWQTDCRDHDLANDLHGTLEHLTPPEALEVLRIVGANLRAEIADFNQAKRADGSP